jgi:streptomycin 6-kinase
VEEVPSGYRAFVARAFGDDGRAWLTALPQLLDELARRWRLALGPELPGGLLSCVRSVTTAAGVEAVLKVGPPWDRSRHEIEALRTWNGIAAPALLDADETVHALLLERIAPGRHADPGDPAEVARLLGHLQTDPPPGLPSLGETVRRRLERAEAERRAPTHKLAWARAALERLEQEQAHTTLVHGDFDDRNLLVCARRGLVAIDPLPCAGDRCYDAGYWVHANRRPGRRARLDGLVAASGLPRERVRDWAAIVAVHG